MNAMDYVQVLALICFAGFVSYTVNEIGKAISSLLND